MSQMKVTTITVLGGQKLEVLRNVAAHNLKRIVRVSFTIGRRQISPSMPYYSSSTSSTVPFASLTSSPTAWNSQFPNNWSRTSLWVLVGSFFACGKFKYFRSRCPDVISLFSDLLISQIFPRVGWRQISPAMPYYSPSTSSAVPLAPPTSPPATWSS